mmetsp:Transcript_18326/g.55169  ORF Transcript_18326/g.55169 Transcript_18326/m.55169 type:complete len:129 (-) Transcript_18326:565-951(-)
MAAMQISASSALTRPQMMPIQRGASRLSAPMRPHSRQAPRQVSRQGLFGLGVPELALVAGAAALLFGPAKIPQLGQALGKTAKSVKAAAEEFQKELQSDNPEGDAKAGATQKVKDPAAGEGGSVRDIE